MKRKTEINEKENEKKNKKKKCMIGNTDKSKRIFFANINKCDISLTRYIKNEKLEPTINLISIKK